MKVLIVDDEAIVRIGLKSIINWAEEGFDCVLEAGNGVEALSLVQKEAPDLIITDIKMPEMNGLELIEALKENQNGASIIVLSSYDDFEFVRQAMKLGATDYILKLQMTEASLSETIRSAMANKHVHNPKDIQGFSRNLQYLQNKLLRDALILGGEAQRILSDMAKALQLCIDPQNCILAVLRYEPVEEACTDAEHKRIFKSALSNTILEICKSKYLFHSVDLDERKLCLLLSGNHECDMSTDAFKPYAYLIVEMLLNYMNLSSTICLCYVGHEGLHSAYVQNEAACGLTDSNLNHTGIYLYSKGKIMIHLTFDYKSDKDCTTPGQYLKYHRTFQGFTTRELAEKVGIVPATLVLYENDRHPIKYNTAVALANELGIDRNRLLDEYAAFVDCPYSSLLKRVRQELSLTQMQMAKAIGIGQTTYSGWERESRIPRRKEHEKILAAMKKLKVDIGTYLCQ